MCWTLIVPFPSLFALFHLCFFMVALLPIEHEALTPFFLALFALPIYFSKF